MTLSGLKPTGAGYAVRSLASDPGILTGVLLVVLLGVLVQKSGGIEATTWYPAAVMALVLAAWTFVTQIRSAPIRRKVLAILGAFAAYLAWCFATIAWSGMKDASWDGSNLGVFYLALLTTAAIVPWRRATVAFLLAILSLIVAVEGFVGVARAVSATDRTHYFDFGRLSAPLGYQNAACAAFLMAIWPLLLAASRREVPAFGRAVALAGACVLPELALLSQSRASIVSGPVTFAVYLILVPRRARTLATAAVPIAALLVTRGRLLEVFPAVAYGHDPAGHLDTARNVLALSAAAGFVAGLAIAALDRGVKSAAFRLWVERIVLALAAVCVLGALVAGAVWFRHPEARLHHAWSSFSALRSGPTSGASYFSNGVSGNRYDIWRVALREFQRAPLQGVGVDNFAGDYLLLRRSQEEPLYPHSVELRVLAQTGAVGAFLVLLFVAAVVLALRHLRRVDETRRAVAGMALTVVAYWLIHGSIDWFWEIPALGGIAFLCLGWAISLTRTEPPPAREKQRHGGLGKAAVAGLAVVAIASMLPPWLAAQETATAIDGWPQDPARAYARLATASHLNPLSSQPDLLAGAIAARVGNWSRMKTSFTAAIARQPDDWYAHLELAIAASHAHAWSAARREAAEARKLDPLEPVVGYVTDQISGRHVVSVTDVDSMFVERILQ
ncbi:MAG TPA: O-antigen ligase family protein [Gaiellaceae bacterium]|jgi:hypothetical protein|nr:O-antigen ligase family protein [Gaiellaceae bacterium]